MPLKNISRPRGLLRLYIIYRLSKKPMSGYDLISDLDEATSGAWRPGSGSIYPILDSLRREGLIEVSSKGPRSKQVYSLTTSGRRTLEERKRMINLFASKWNNIRVALTDLVSAESLSTLVLETTKFNRVAWDRILESKELTKGQTKLTLKEYKLLLNSELRWTSERLKSLA